MNYVDTDQVIAIEWVVKLVAMERLVSQMKGYYQVVPASTWYKLSPGEAQKVYLARALIQKPSIIILDESLTFIEHGVIHDIFRFCHDMDITVITISNDLALAKYHPSIVELGNDGK